MFMHNGFRAILGAAALVGFLLISVGGAQAQQTQFKFNVKTDFKDLNQDVSAVVVFCRVCSGKKCGRNTFLGSAKVIVPTGGNATFNQQVSVPVNVDNGKEPLDVTAWQCFLGLDSAALGVSSGNFQGNGVTPSQSAEEVAFRTAKGAKLVTELSGSIQ